MIKSRGLIPRPQVPSLRPSLSSGGAGLHCASRPSTWDPPPPNPITSQTVSFLPGIFPAQRLLKVDLTRVKLGQPGPIGARTAVARGQGLYPSGALGVCLLRKPLSTGTPTKQGAWEGSLTCCCVPGLSLASKRGQYPACPAPTWDLSP